MERMSSLVLSLFNWILVLESCSPTLEKYVAVYIIPCFIAVDPFNCYEHFRISIKRSKNIYFPAVILNVSSCVNPVVYALITTEVRQALAFSVRRYLSETSILSHLL